MCFAIKCLLLGMKEALDDVGGQIAVSLTKRETVTRWGAGGPESEREMRMEEREL